MGELTKGGAADIEISHVMGLSVEPMIWARASPQIDNAESEIDKPC